MEGREFQKVFEDMVKIDAMPLGLHTYTHIRTHICIMGFEDMVKIDAIPLGLQRQPRPEAGNSLPIVYTCPDPMASAQKVRT